MTNFRLRKDANSKTWFKDLYLIKESDPSQSRFTVEFDALYFCFMAAISTGRKAPDVPFAETAELIDYFPKPYSERKYILVAALLTAELKLLGVDMDNKKEVHGAISHLIHPNSPSLLSEEGVREFNKYAYAGFDVLQEWFDDRPRFMHTFLREFEANMPTPSP